MSRSSRVYTPRRGTGVPAHVRAETIRELYRNADGSLPDFSQLDRRSTSRRWIIIGALSTLALLAVAAWAGLLIFKPYATTTSSALAVTIEAPESAEVGSEVTYRILLQNTERVPIARMSVDLKLPPDFVLTATDPAPTDAATPSWTLGSMPARSERTLTVRGRIYSAPGDAPTLEATAFYRPANFNADFQTATTRAVTLNTTPLALTLEGPERIAPGSPATYTLTYEHRGSTPLPPLTIAWVVPPSFTLTTAVPDRPKREELRWPLGELAPGSKGAMTLTGQFNGDASGELIVRAAAGIELDGGRRIAQAEATRTTNVLGGDVALTTTVNDQARGVDARAGDTLRYRIAIRNTGAAEFRNLTIRAVFEATSANGKSVLDFNRITDPSNGTAIGEQLAPDRRRGTITWAPPNTPSLLALPPGEQATIDIALPVHTADTLPGFSGTGAITLTTSVTIAATGTTAEPRTITGPPLAVHVR